MTEDAPAQRPQTELRTFLKHKLGEVQEQSKRLGSIVNDYKETLDMVELAQSEEELKQLVKDGNFNMSDVTDDLNAFINGNSSYLVGLNLWQDVDEKKFLNLDKDPLKKYLATAKSMTDYLNKDLSDALKEIVVAVEGVSPLVTAFVSKENEAKKDSGKSELDDKVKLPQMGGEAKAAEAAARFKEGEAEAEAAAASPQDAIKPVVDKVKEVCTKIEETQKAIDEKLAEFQKETKTVDELGPKKARRMKRSADEQEKQDESQAELKLKRSKDINDKINNQLEYKKSREAIETKEAKEVLNDKDIVALKNQISNILANKE